MSPFPPPRRPQTWFITDAGDGLGQLVAELVLLRGDRVLAAGRHLAPLQELADSYPGRVVPLHGDLSVPGTADRLVQEAMGQERHVDVLVLTDSEGLLAPLEHTTDGQVRRQFDVNFFGPLALVRALLPVLRQQRSGHLVTVSGIHGFVGAAGHSVFSATRFALEGLCEALAQELGPLGLSVTLVEPGPLRTGWSWRTYEDAPAPRGDYAATVGVARAHLEAQRGREAGDPLRAAEAILDAVAAPRPPQRLVLGHSALARARRKLQQAAADLAKWEHVAWSVDRPERLAIASRWPSEEEEDDEDVG